MAYEDVENTFALSSQKKLYKSSLFETDSILPPFRPLENILRPNR